MDKVEYEALLNKIYNGKVKAKNRYINPIAVLLHKCIGCNENFYGVPKFMVSESQRHMCGLSIGVNGERVASVNTSRNNRKKKSKKSEEDITPHLNALIKHGLPPEMIASTLKIDLAILKDHMKKLKEQQAKREKELQIEKPQYLNCW